MGGSNKVLAFTLGSGSVGLITRAVVTGVAAVAELFDDSTVVVALVSVAAGVATGLVVAGTVAGALCPVIV